MTNEEIYQYLKAEAEETYRNFTSTLTPGASEILGVRIPKIRALAKRIAKEDWRTYLKQAQSTCHEELLLQAYVIGYAKGDIDELLDFAADFIPKIHDWSVNDSFCSAFQTARKNREKVWAFLMKYKTSEHEFEQRMTAVMLMDHFLTEEYLERVFGVWEELTHPGYYCRMGVAWGVATAYAKFPQETHAFLLRDCLDCDTRKKAIQKMLESYRISEQDKEKLRQMKS